MTAKLYRIILPVTDIDLATRFYCAVLDDPGKRVSQGRHYFGGNGSGAVLACYDPQADGDELGEGWRHHACQYLYFAVSDIQQAQDVCTAAGASNVTPIDNMPWGERLFYAVDPFNNPISFVQSGTEFTG